MKKNLLSIGLLAAGLAVNAQVTSTPSVLTHVDNGALFYVGKGALVYNGGGLQTKGDATSTATIENHGNIMVVGNGTTDVLRTLNGTTDKAEGATVGGVIINKLNEPNNYAANNTTADGNNYSYGQLYISGLTQSNVKAIVNQEFRQVKHGAYQQMAVPFYNKTFSTYNDDLGKTFSTQRWSQNEILVWSNENAVFYHLTNLATKSTQAASPTHYWVFGGASLDPTQTRTLKGVPYAEESTPVYQLKNAAAGINFGPGGNNVNSQNEKYNTYVQDGFEIANGGTAWVNDYGRNIYQLSNPYLTNIDLRLVGYTEGGSGATPVTDNVALSNIRGIRFELQGGVTWNGTTGTANPGVNNRFVTFTNGASAVPTGDIDYMVVRPMGTFSIKLLNNTDQPNFQFTNLRRFNYTSRAANVNYSVTAAKSSAQNTVKQLGVIALDANGKEVAKTYYVVYPDGTTGHSTSARTQITATSADLMGTFEELPTGGVDPNFQNSYWLRINEANETDFTGKAIPMTMFGDIIKSLKFEIRENADLVPANTHTLAAGKGFYYQLQNGNAMPISHGQTVPVTVVNSGTNASLYYGQPNSAVLSTTDVKDKSRTMVVYNPLISNYIVRFDPMWKSADIQVFDMSGKVVISEKKVKTDKDYVIDLAENIKSGYVVSIISDQGVKVSTKILK